MTAGGEPQASQTRVTIITSKVAPQFGHARHFPVCA